MKPAGPWAPLGRSQDRRAHRNMCAQAAHSLASKKRSKGGLHHASNASVQKQNPQNARRNTLPGEQISRWFLLLSEKLSASNYPGAAYNRGGIRSASRGFRDLRCGKVDIGTLLRLRTRASCRHAILGDRKSTRLNSSHL